ncbi:MAG: signal peptidase I [Pseudomonadota bacterium]
MNTLFPLILVILTLLCFIIWLWDTLFLRAKRQAAGKTAPWFIDYGRSFLPVFIIVLIIRSFIFQLYRVPTGSLVPTVLPGDFILVEQYAYGLYLPVIHSKILTIGKPERGDIAVFRWPPNQRIDYIKRIVGIPGDHIVYKNHQLYVNGKKMSQKILGDMDYTYDRKFAARVIAEDLTGVTHKIIIDPTQSEDGKTGFDFTVPKGFYFAMGDNRDDSSDSRMWGFVPAANLVGKAYRIVFSWDSQNNKPRWSRIWDKLYISREQQS